MEKCYFNLKSSHNFNNFKEYDRLYIGEELCDNIFCKNIKKYETIINKSNNLNSLTIVLPVINEETLLQVEKFLKSIILRHANKIEIVSNDIGIMNMLIKNNYRNIISGRLLTRTIINYLIDKEDSLNLTKYISRVEIDDTNFKRIRHLKKYKISYYESYSLFGMANNRCCFKKNINQKDVKSLCNYDCESKGYELSNYYLNENFFLFKNAILKKNNSRIYPSLIDRIIKVKI